MSADEPATVVKGIRQAIQDVLAPDIREIRADISATTQRLEDVREDVGEWRIATKQTHKRFERIEHQLETYQDVQTLKEQMAELRAKQQPSA